MGTRGPIHYFEVANPIYDNVTVKFYTVENGSKSGTLAPLYVNQVTGEQLPNPQKLDKHGRLAQTTFIAGDVIAEINSIQVPAHDSGIIVKHGYWIVTIGTPPEVVDSPVIDNPDDPGTGTGGIVIVNIPDGVVVTGQITVAAGFEPDSVVVNNNGTVTDEQTSIPDLIWRGNPTGSVNILFVRLNAETLRFVLDEANVQHPTEDVYNIPHLYVVTVEPGETVEALVFGGFPIGSEISLINLGSIVGAGGNAAVSGVDIPSFSAGGIAIIIQDAISIDIANGSGFIGGGGGGGGYGGVGTIGLAFGVRTGPVEGGAGGGGRGGTSDGSQAIGGLQGYIVAEVDGEIIIEREIGVITDGINTAEITLVPTAGQNGSPGAVGSGGLGGAGSFAGNEFAGSISDGNGGDGGEYGEPGEPGHAAITTGINTPGTTGSEGGRAGYAIFYNVNATLRIGAQGNNGDQIKGEVVSFDPDED